jgi:preprotein translocase subunit YajC
VIRLNFIRFFILSAVILSPEVLFAQQELAKPSLMSQLITMLPMLIMIIGIFYVLVVLPQKKEYQKQQQLIASLKKGDEVVTHSGIIAKLASIEKDHVLLDLANNVKVKFETTQIKALLKDSQSK